MMKRQSRKMYLTFTIFISLFILNLATPVSSIDFESNNYTIKLFKDGSAVWIIESSTPLSSREDLEAFTNYAENFENYRESLLENFTQSIQKIVSDVSRYVNRPMRAEDFNVSVGIVDTLSGKIGRLTYTFKWVGFSEVKDGMLIIGDVFIGGFYLYEGDSLTIILPEEYSINEVHPPPDKRGETEITWFGKKLFPDRAPYVKASIKTLAMETLTIETNVATTYSTISTSEYSTSVSSMQTSWIGMLAYFPVIIPIVVITILMIIFISRRRERKFTVKDADEVINVIRELGGSAFQKQLVEKTGFSKAKVSEILSALEKNGVVERVKVGRSKLIVLKKKAKQS